MKFIYVVSISNELQTESVMITLLVNVGQHWQKYYCCYLSMAIS